MPITRTNYELFTWNNKLACHSSTLLKTDRKNRLIRYLNIIGTHIFMFTLMCFCCDEFKWNNSDPSHYCPTVAYNAVKWKPHIFINCNKRHFLCVMKTFAIIAVLPQICWQINFTRSLPDTQCPCKFSGWLHSLLMTMISGHCLGWCSSFINKWLWSSAWVQELHIDRNELLITYPWFCCLRELHSIGWADGAGNTIWERPEPVTKVGLLYK